MSRTPMLVRAAILGAVVATVATGCSSGGESDGGSGRATPRDPGPTSYTAENLTCDFDRAAPSAQDTNERVGGRVEDGFRVRFSRTTDVGIVALVTGDTKKAYDFLHREFDVAIVAQVEKDKDTGRIVSFQQVADLVAAVCG